MDPTHAILGGGWNLSSEALESSGFPRTLGTLIASPSAFTCRAPSSNSVIDYFVMGPGMSRLIARASAGAFVWRFEGGSARLKRL
eukprot:3145995-Pyramimonas_sp.AAC.1